jgi:hypothetical protein
MILQSGREDYLDAGTKTMVKRFLCDRVTLAGHPFQPPLRSSGFVLSVSEGSEC